MPTSLPSISPHIVTTSPITTSTPTKDTPPLNTLTTSPEESVATVDDKSKDTEAPTDEWKETQVNPLSQTQLKKEEDSSAGVGATLSSVHIAIHVSFLVGIVFLSL